MAYRIDVDRGIMKPWALTDLAPVRFESRVELVESAFYSDRKLHQAVGQIGHTPSELGPDCIAPSATCREDPI